MCETRGFQDRLRRRVGADPGGDVARADDEGHTVVDEVEIFGSFPCEDGEVREEQTVRGKMILPPHGKEFFHAAVSSFLHFSVRTFLHNTVRTFLHDLVSTFFVGW